MLHNYLRRLEGNQDVGSWSFAPAAMRSMGMLFQIMGPGPDCEQERLLLSRKASLQFADALREAINEQSDFNFELSDENSCALILKESGEDGLRIELRDTRLERSVTASFAIYDALELASAIYTDTLSQEMIEAIEKARSDIRMS